MRQVCGGERVLGLPAAWPDSRYHRAMTPPIQPGDPVRLITRARPPARHLPLLAGVVETIDGDRAWVRWADGARSSSRLQFLRPTPDELED